MFNFNEDQIDEMRARVHIEDHPAANSPLREAIIRRADGLTTWCAYQSWRMRRASAPGRNDDAIVWDRCKVSFPGGHVGPEDLAEMVLALLVLGEIAEKWNADAGQPIPEQMARIATEEAAHNAR